jgi:hypothetical protein
MQRSNLGPHLGRLGIGGSGAIERRPGAFDVAVGFEPSSQQEFVVGVRWRLSQGRQRHPDSQGSQHDQCRAARKQHHAMILAQDAIFPSRS